MRPIAVLTVLAVLALACNLGIPSAVQQVAEEVAEQAATQVPAAMTSFVEPTPSPAPTTPPEEVRTEQPGEATGEAGVCAELGVPTGVPLPVPGFAGWTGGEPPAGPAADLNAWAAPFLQQVGADFTLCGWAAYSGTGEEVAVLGFEAQLDPVAAGETLREAFQARGYEVEAVTAPGLVYLNLPSVPDLGGSHLLVYVAPQGVAFFALRQTTP